MNSRWADIFNHLKQEGFEVYPPATKRGECKKPYIVVKYQGKMELTEISSNVVTYDILLYVPRNCYSEIEDRVRELEISMDKMFPLIRPTHFTTEPYYDDDVKGWMTSTQYENYQKRVRY